MARGCSGCRRANDSSLMRESAAAVHRLVDHPGDLGQFGAILHPVGDHLDAAGDHREDVIEIMRHAAGELADRFHLLGLVQLPFGLPRCRDVVIDDDGALPLAGAVGNGAPAGDQPDHAGFAGPADTDLDIVKILAARGASEQGLIRRDRRGAIRVEAVKGPGPARRAVWRHIADQTLPHRIAEQHAALGVDHQHRIGHAVDGLVEHLRLATERLGLLGEALGHVGEGGGKDADLAGEPPGHRHRPATGESVDRLGDLDQRPCHRSGQQYRQQDGEQHGGAGGEQVGAPRRAGRSQQHGIGIGLDDAEPRAISHLRSSQRHRHLRAAGIRDHRGAAPGGADRAGKPGQLLLPAVALAELETEGMAGVRVQQEVAIGIDQVDQRILVHGGADPFEDRTQVEVDDDDAERLASGVVQRRGEAHHRHVRHFQRAMLLVELDRRNVNFAGWQHDAAAEIATVALGRELLLRHNARGMVRSGAVDADDLAAAIGEADQAKLLDGRLGLRLREIDALDALAPDLGRSAADRIVASGLDGAHQRVMGGHRAHAEHVAAQTAQIDVEHAEPGARLGAEPLQCRRHHRRLDAVIADQSRRRGAEHQPGHRDHQACRKIHAGIRTPLAARSDQLSRTGCM